MLSRSLMRKNANLGNFHYHSILGNLRKCFTYFWVSALGILEINALPKLQAETSIKINLRYKIAKGGIVVPEDTLTPHKNILFIITRPHFSRAPITTDDHMQ